MRHLSDSIGTRLVVKLETRDVDSAFSKTPEKVLFREKLSYQLCVCYVLSPIILVVDFKIV